MIEGSGSVYLTNGSGSGRPKNMDPPDPDPQHCFFNIYSRLTQKLFRWCPHTDSAAAAAAVCPVRRTSPHQLQHVQEEVAQGEAAGQAGPHARQRHRGDHHHRRRESRRCDEKVQTRLVWCGFGCVFRMMWSTLQSFVIIRCSLPVELKIIFVPSTWYSLAQSIR